MKRKPLSEQTIVVTGAYSGIGLTTARSADVFAKRAAELGPRVVHVVADVGSRADVQAIAAEAIATFGGFDTRLNGAGLTVYGPSIEISGVDHERRFVIVPRSATWVPTSAR